MYIRKGIDGTLTQVLTGSMFSFFAVHVINNLRIPFSVAILISENVSCTVNV